MPKKTTRDALKILDQRIGDDAEMRRLIEEERTRANIAQMIYDARTKAGLSQAELARRVGTHQSAIARLEDADYDGYSTKTLSRIAEALGVRLEIKFVKMRSERVGA